jgi:Flp pilus assembly protein TadB
MTCARCRAEPPLAKSGWCPPCERAYDTWVRRHATDIIWAVMTGGVVIAVLGVGLPALGLGPLVGASAAFVGAGTIGGMYRLTQRRRRRQFLIGALPRAYLAAPK